MGRLRRHGISAVALAILAAARSGAQVSPPQQSTRFTVAVAPILSQPKEEFRTVGNGFGAGGALLYSLDRSGVFSIRFDGSGLAYGHEKKQVPLSQTIGGRILADLATTNSIAAFGIGPELAIPVRSVRPYLNAALSGLLFTTSSSVGGTDSDEDFASTTNYKDWARAWVFGSGVRIPLPFGRSRLGLDLGVRYHRGGQASYLREGSIQDNPDGSISFTPLNTRTPYMVYLIGIRFQIPYDSPNPCPRFLC